MRLSVGAPDLIRNLVSEGSIGNGRIMLIMEANELANDVNLKPKESDVTALRIEAPFALRRRGVEGRIVVGDREPKPNPSVCLGPGACLDSRSVQRQTLEQNRRSNQPFRILHSNPGPDRLSFACDPENDL